MTARFLIIATAFAAGSLAQSDRRFLIAPGQYFGLIREGSSRGDLAQAYGPKAVSDHDVQIGEGLCTPGTRIFSGTADQVEMAWQDEQRTRVAQVTVRGGRWITRRGVRIGTTLRQLERLAGKPLEFAGFGWDYSGRMLWPEPQAGFAVFLTYDSVSAPRLSEQELASITGDKLIRSDLSVVRRLPIVISRFIQSWGAPIQVHDCQ